MTQPVEPEPEDEEIIDATIVEASDAETLEFQSPAAPAESADPRDTSSPWFGYIGIGIALVAMLIGLAGVVVAIFVFIGWTQG
ncbi:MAG TPA: hypothetical protein VK797_04180 [Tepidisphaeraceae bacterium]|nr:hypothetical protein [Tepidisphaeraceae bacterium]